MDRDANHHPGPADARLHRRGQRPRPGGCLVARPGIRLRSAILSLLVAGAWIGATCFAAVPQQYLFIGHPRSDTPGEIVQREVERIDYSAFDLLLLGGDYTLNGTGTRQTVSYLDAIFDFASPATLAALGNHDTANKSYFTEATGRPRFYAQVLNGITFVVLDTTDDSRNILGAELQMLSGAIAAMPANSHLVIIHHHIIWLTDNAINCEHYGDNNFIAASSSTLSGLNFYSAVYPLLLQARAKGCAVTCLAGDRTGSSTEEYYIDHTTAEGVRLIAAGLQDTLNPALRTVVVLDHDLEAGSLIYHFKHLTDLPKIPDEPLVINELHYNPSATQGDDTAFIELFNRGVEAYDLSGAKFSSGVVCTFPASTIVAPGETILVAANPIHFDGLGVRVFDWQGTAVPTLGAPIWLRDSRGLEIDFLKYGNSAPWPSLPNNQGASLMLIDPGVDNNLATHWATSDQLGGTPGRANIPPPWLGNMEIGTETTSLDWNGVVVGGWYRLDYTPELSPADWQPAGAAIQATSTSIQLSDPDTMGATRRFFRLSRLFP